MFTKIKEFLFGKPAPVSAEAPYKIEVPEPVSEVNPEVKSDGGTWPFPALELTVQPEEPAAKITKAKKAPVKKSSAKPKPKAPAKPRTPKPTTK